MQTVGQYPLHSQLSRTIAAVVITNNMILRFTRCAHLNTIIKMLVMGCDDIQLITVMAHS